MWDRLTDWLRRTADRVRYPGQSVQYELHRMTYKGGWKNFYTDPEGMSMETFPTPPPKPSFGEDTGWPPGKYRCLRRVDGRIKSTMWTVESSDADAYYANLRERAAAEAAAPSLDDVEAGLEEGSTEPLAEWLKHQLK